MKFLALGINHRTASLDVRERVAFAPERMVAALQQACQAVGLDEVVILSTCNRTDYSCTALASRMINVCWTGSLTTTP